MRGREKDVWLYGLLLSLFPESYRSEYGRQMEQAFADMRREERYARRRGSFRLWRRVLPDLAAGVISERSRTMGNALARATRLATLGNLMLLNAAVLLTCGLALAWAPGPMSDAYGLSTAFLDEDPRSTIGNAHLAIVRFLGVVSVGFGSLLLVTSRVAGVWSPRSVSGALFVLYLLGTLLLLIQQTEIWVSAIGWVTVAVHLFFAASYGFFCFRSPTVGASVYGGAPVPSGESN